jgi:tetratricopeptide (TPR) repeat protein
VALIGDGRVDEAVALFGADFDAGGVQDPMAADAAVGVALALQAAGEHEHAAVLLSRVLAMATRPRQRRELLLLAAEAEGRAGQHERAARLYIESAAVPDGGPADAWSYSASLEAARALARSGLAEDAVGVLQSALANGPPSDQRVLVEHVLRRF